MRRPEWCQGPSIWLHAGKPPSVCRPLPDIKDSSCPKRRPNFNDSFGPHNPYVPVFSSESMVATDKTQTPTRQHITYSLLTLLKCEDHVFIYNKIQGLENLGGFLDSWHSGSLKPRGSESFSCKPPQPTQSLMASQAIGRAQAQWQRGLLGMLRC